MADAHASFFPLPDGGRLRYTLTFPAEPQRRTVMLSGMLATTGAVWDDVVPVLHDAGFRVLTFDHPGHGGSSAPADLAANTMPSMADNIYAMLQAVLASPKPVVHAYIGCSLGSAMGVVFSTRFPGTVQRLVVGDTNSAAPCNVGAADPLSPRVQAARAHGSLAALLPATRERWLGKSWLAAHPDKDAWLTRLMDETTLDGFEACIAALVSPTFDLRPLAPKLATSVERVIIVVGEKDADLPETMKELEGQIRDGFVAAGKTDESLVSFHILPNAGHACFIDAFEPFKEVVLPFLQ